MKKCHDIENLLPLYEEGVLSDAEKLAVEQHLADCAICRKEMAYLKKAGQLVNQLPPVEEPPWFQQKIMAQVREEAEKTSPARRWFYPLRIKIPVQIMATIVIAVLAVYIYRSGNEQMKQVLPGVRPPAAEVQKDHPQLPPELPQAKEMAEPAVQDRNATVREEVRRDKEPMRDMTAESRIQKSVKPESKSQEVSQINSGKTTGLAEKKDKNSSAAGGRPEGRKSEKAEVYPSIQAVPEHKSAEADLADSERKAQDRFSMGMAKEKKAYKMTAPAAPRSMAASPVGPLQTSVSLRVENLSAAAEDVEKILAGYEGKIKSRQMQDRKVMMQVEVSGTHWKDILLKLKKLGPVEEKSMPPNISEKNISAVIEIILVD